MECDVNDDMVRTAIADVGPATAVLLSSMKGPVFVKKVLPQRRSRLRPLFASKAWLRRQPAGSRHAKHVGCPVSAPLAGHVWRRGRLMRPKAWAAVQGVACLARGSAPIRLLGSCKVSSVMRVLAGLGGERQ